LRAYAGEQGITIVREYIDIETAKASGRTHFTAMIGYLKSHPASTPSSSRKKLDRPTGNLRIG